MLHFQLLKSSEMSPKFQSVILLLIYCSPLKWGKIISRGISPLLFCSSYQKLLELVQKGNRASTFERQRTRQQLLQLSPIQMSDSCSSAKWSTDPEYTQLEEDMDNEDIDTWSPFPEIRKIQDIAKKFCERAIELAEQIDSLMTQISVLDELNITLGTEATMLSRANNKLTDELDIAHLATTKYAEAAARNNMKWKLAAVFGYVVSLGLVVMVAMTM